MLDEGRAQSSDIENSKQSQNFLGKKTSFLKSN
jgi:hypothetical protein